jgi:PPOX class probable F420-dependent enzyme
MFDAKYINLTTYRKIGTPVTTVVWFAFQEGTIYVITDPSSGKVKRIRHTPRVLVAPCTAHGKVLDKTFVGQARLLADPEERVQANQALSQKYGWLYSAFFGFAHLMDRLRRKPPVEDVFIAIEALEEAEE